MKNTKNSMCHDTWNFTNSYNIILNLFLSSKLIQYYKRNEFLLYSFED